MLPPSSSPNFFTTPIGAARGLWRCWNSSTVRRRAFRSMPGFLPDQLQHRGLDLLAPLRPDLAAAAEIVGEGVAVAVAVEDAGVDVGATADRRRVAERFGDRFDSGVDDPFAGGLGGRFGLTGEGQRGEHGAVPGAEVLGRELGPGVLLDVVVDGAGADVAPAAAVLVGEQGLWEG